MVTQTSHRGLREWLLQRISAVLIGAYAVVLIYFVASHQPLTYAIWQGFFAELWVKYATLAVVALIAIHAWIGLWTIFTDYIKPVALRLLFEALVAIALLGLLVWSFIMLWGY